MILIFSSGQASLVGSGSHPAKNAGGPDHGRDAMTLSVSDAKQALPFAPDNLGQTNQLFGENPSLP